MTPETKKIYIHIVVKGLIFASLKFKSANTFKSTKYNLKEEEPEEIQNFPCLYDKKKIKRRTHGLECRMPAAARKVRKLNYKDN